MGEAGHGTRDTVSFFLLRDKYYQRVLSPYVIFNIPALTSRFLERSAPSSRSAALQKRKRPPNGGRLIKY